MTDEANGAPTAPDRPSSNLDEARRELLKDEETLAQILKLRNPPKPSRWHESPGLVALLTLISTGGIGFATAQLQKQHEVRLAIKKAHLERAEETIGKSAQLVAGLLLGCEDRGKMAKGQYDALSGETLDRITDSTNAADLRWRLGREINELNLRFYFGNDALVMRRWSEARHRLQKYSDCVEKIYQTAINRKIPAQLRRAPDSCTSHRDSAFGAVDLLNGQLIRAYQELEDL